MAVRGKLDTFTRPVLDRDASLLVLAVPSGPGRVNNDLGSRRGHVSQPQAEGRMAVPRSPILELRYAWPNRRMLALARPSQQQWIWPSAVERAGNLRSPHSLRDSIGADTGWSSYRSSVSPEELRQSEAPRARHSSSQSTTRYQGRPNYPLSKWASI